MTNKERSVEEIADELCDGSERLYKSILKALQAERQKREEVVDYLSHFSYEDWDIGDDDKLRVGDCINLNHQRGHDGYEQNLEGKIVLHDTNKLPVLLYNIEPETEDEEESGDYGDLQSFFMNGWTFSRIKALTKTNNTK